MSCWWKRSLRGEKRGGEETRGEKRRRGEVKTCNQWIMCLIPGNLWIQTVRWRHIFNTRIILNFSTNHLTQTVRRDLFPAYLSGVFVCCLLLQISSGWNCHLRWWWRWCYFLSMVCRHGDSYRRTKERTQMFPGCWCGRTIMGSDSWKTISHETCRGPKTKHHKSPNSQDTGQSKTASRGPQFQDRWTAWGQSTGKHLSLRRTVSEAAASTLEDLWPPTDQSPMRSRSLEGGTEGQHLNSTFKGQKHEKNID